VLRGYATHVEEESAYYAVDVEEAAAILQQTPDRLREMLVTGELEGIPPGATVAGDWKVLLPATLRQEPDQGAPVDEAPESPPEEQEESPADEEPAQRFVEPQRAGVAEDPAAASADLSRGVNADTDREVTAPSGWVSTQQAAKALGISPRTVRWHIEQGSLEAKPEGEGVRRSWLVSIDSLQAFRNARQAAGDTPRGHRAPAEDAAIATQSLGNPIRELADRLAEEAARAAEYRVRLELTEQAESTLRAELEETRRRREEVERERDKLRRELEALREQTREPAESPGPPVTPTGTGGGPQEAREATQRAAETLRGPEQHPTTGGAQESPQRPPQAGRRRGRLRARLWRRVFGR
jgi:DNA-binding transcriptional MerR regulator